MVRHATWRRSHTTSWAASQTSKKSKGALMILSITRIWKEALTVSTVVTISWRAAGCKSSGKRAQTFPQRLAVKAWSSNFLPIAASISAAFPQTHFDNGVGPKYTVPFEAASFMEAFCSFTLFCIHNKLFCTSTLAPSEIKTCALKQPFAARSTIVHR